MDERIAGLLDSYPQIFESRVPKTGDFEDEFVVINIPNASDSSEEQLVAASEVDAGLDDPFNDNEYWDAEVSDKDFLRKLDSIANPWVWLGENYSGQGRLTDRIKKRIKGTFPGSPGGKPAPLMNAPPPDALAFYLPFHRYPDYWGIYLIDTGINALSLAIGADMHSRGHSSLRRQDLRAIAKAYLYHHEAYHSAVEAFAVRAELSMRRPFYRTGLRKLYTRPWIPGTPHEETLATAYGLRKVRDNLKLPSPLLSAAMGALNVYIQRCAPEYAAAVNFVEDSKFVALEQQFKERATNENLASKVILAPEVWQIGTFLMAPLIQRNRKYSWICDRSDFRRRSKLAIHYFRRNDVVRCLAKLAETEMAPGGRHMHLVREICEDGSTRKRRTQVPSGEIKAGTLSRMLKDLEIPMSSHEFRDRCRNAGEAVS